MYKQKQGFVQIEKEIGSGDLTGVFHYKRGGFRERKQTFLKGKQ